MCVDTKKGHHPLGWMPIVSDKVAKLAQPSLFKIAHQQGCRSRLSARAVASHSSSSVTAYEVGGGQCSEIADFNS